MRLFLQDGLIFLVNLKRGSPSHVLASVVAPFWWSPTWKLCDTYLYLSQLVCHAILNKSLRTRKKMGDKFFRIIASPFACAKLVCCSSSLLHSRHSSGNWCLVVSFPPVATWWETSPQTIHEAIFVTIRILYVVSVIQIQVLFLFSFENKIYRKSDQSISNQFSSFCNHLKN